MTLRERIDKLDPRERRLLGVFGAIVAFFLVLAGPVAIVSILSDRRAQNEELRDLIDDIHAARASLSERRAKQDALLARYAKPAPQLAGFIEEAARANGLAAAESQDRPETPHGKRYIERSTVVRLHKVGMLALLHAIEKIEQSGFPVAVTRLNIKPRVGEHDSYEVELGVSAFDRKPDTKKEDKDAAAAPSASAAEREP